MIICVCRRVSDRDIARAAAGCASFEALQSVLGVATACGKCRDCALETFAQHRAGAGAAGPLATRGPAPAVALPPAPAQGHPPRPSPGRGLPVTAAAVVG